MGLAHEWALSAPPGPMRRSGGLLGAPDFSSAPGGLARLRAARPGFESGRARSQMGRRDAGSKFRCIRQLLRSLPLCWPRSLRGCLVWGWIDRLPKTAFTRFPTIEGSNLKRPQKGRGQAIAEHTTSASKGSTADLLGGSLDGRTRPQSRQSGSLAQGRAKVDFAPRAIPSYRCRA